MITIIPVLELETKLREYITITEKAPTTQAFSWCLLDSALTFKTLLRRYAKQALTHGKQTCNWDAGAKIIT